MRKIVILFFEKKPNDKTNKTKTKCSELSKRSINFKFIDFIDLLMIKLSNLGYKAKD